VFVRVTTVVSLVLGLTALITILYFKAMPFLTRGKIEVTRVKLSDDGSSVDINYSVKKPGRVSYETAEIFLLDELRAKKIKATDSEVDNVIDINTRVSSTGKIQLPNKYKTIKKGSFVTVAIGDYRREYLIVV